MKNIKMIVLDVDGTLTNGNISLFYNNATVSEIKSFNVQDGMGITMWIKSGGLVSIISGRKCQLTIHRAKELGISEVHLGIENKLACLQEICKKYKLVSENLACIGDDVNDLEMYSYCAYSFAPANATISNKQKANFITNAKGGEGAVREMIDFLLSLKNK